MTNWYPPYVYSKREDVTRENMKQYDEKRNAAYDEIATREKELGRYLTMKERFEIRDKHGL